MNSIILCEGFDDSYILGYYLHKTSGTSPWMPLGAGQRFSKSYGLPRLPHLRKQAIDQYGRGQDRLAIWCVGGKDSFSEPIAHIRHLSLERPQERFEEIFLVADRDTENIPDCLRHFEQVFAGAGWTISLENNQTASVSYTVEEETFSSRVTPIVIPFDREGALETLLMGAIAQRGEEERFIVDAAERFVTSLVESGQLRRYLQKERLRLKSRFSTVISVTNPDRSTALFDHLLMSFPWEASPRIREHFGILEERLHHRQYAGSL